MSTRYRVGALFFDPASRRLHGGDGHEIPLEPRVFDLLAYLVDNHDRAVTKEELWQNVWEGRPVSESVIPHAVSKLRKALATAGEGDTVAVVHGHGYRLALTPTPVDEDLRERARALPRDRSAPHRARWIAAAALVAAAALAGPWLVRNVGADAERVAVLPVRNETGDARLDWARLGLLPLIEDSLSSAGLQPVSTGTVLSTLNRYPDAVEAVDQAGRVAASTGAPTVLAVRLGHSGDHYVITVDDVSGSEIPELRMQGSDLPMLAVQAAAGAAGRLGAVGPATGFRPALTEDSFVNEAFARGLDARLRSDNESAQKYFETVLATAPELDYAIYQLSLVHRHLGDWPRTREFLERLEKRARSRGNARMLANAWSGLGILAWYQGDLETAGRRYRRALRQYRELGLAHNAAGAEVNLAILAANRGEFDAAERAFLSALDTWQTHGDNYSAARTLKNLGVLAIDRDRFERAREYLERSLALRRDLGLDREVAMTLSSLSDLEWAEGNFTRVEALQRRILAAAREAGDKVLEALALVDLSKALLELGRVDAAAQRAAQAHAAARELGSASEEALALVQLGRASAAAGNTARARQLFEEALSIHAGSGRRPAELAVRLELAELLLAEGDEQVFAEHYDAARTLAEELEVAGYQAELWRIEARHALRTNRIDQALAAYRAALQASRDAGMKVEAERIAAELGSALLEIDPRTDEVRALARELSESPLRTPRALGFLAAVEALDGDYAAAAQLAAQGRELAGERWTGQDEARLQEYRREADDT